MSMKLHSKSNQLLILFRTICHFIFDLGSISYSHSKYTANSSTPVESFGSHFFKTNSIRKQLRDSMSMRLWSRRVIDRQFYPRICVLSSSMQAPTLQLWYIYRDCKWARRIVCHNKIQNLVNLTLIKAFNLRSWMRSWIIRNKSMRL